MEIPYEFSPAERPLLPGSPYSPSHPTWRRCVYAGVALMAATTATLGNALVSTNIGNIAGSVGEYIAVASVLPAMYVAFNATGNLSVVKARIRWGIPAATQATLVLYASVALLQLCYPNFALAIVVRAANGLCAAALITLTAYYLLQVFSPKLRPAALIVGLGLTQLGVPLARLFPVEMLAQNHWQALHLIDLALPLFMLALMNTFPLPPSDRESAFERLDFLTIGLAVPAMTLICAVLALGRPNWWTDTPLLGWALAAGFVLAAAALLIEANRLKPLLFLEWIGSGVILRFAAVALLVRIALAEQTFGSVGLLTYAGLDNDQLRVLFLIVLAAMLLGIATAVLTLHPQRLKLQVIVASLCIAAGAWIDCHATNLVRPPQLYLSQSLIGFGTTLFIGPTLAFGLIRMLERGPGYFISLVVLFSTTQNVGSLAGSALLGSLEFEAARAHATALAEHVTAADPQVVARLQAGSHLLSGALVDPALLAGQSASLLAQAEGREAAVLAFNDVFWVVALLGFSTAAIVFCFELKDRWRAGRAAATGLPA